ncbi:MAG: hypothetical protein IH936_07530 [Acidobacteria bacterium]|nr:hypothetical protein [Acidobacteriota bacterium]
MSTTSATPSWGAMINAGRGHLLDAPHLALSPGIAILITVMGLNFLGDGLVDYLDPRGGGPKRPPKSPVTRPVA